MILGRPLTACERKRAQHFYNLFSLVNGASYMCLGENVLILFAVHLAAPNWVVALLGSMMFLGYFVMPLGVLRTAKVGAARCQADFWVGRNLAALTIALSVFAERLSPGLAWGIVVAGAFLFYGFRAAGCVLSAPLIGDIATPEETPILISRNNGCFYLSGTAMLLAIAALLHFSENVWMLVGVIGFGAALGITASTFIRQINETGGVRDAARQKLLPGIRAVFANPDIRRFAPGWFCLNMVILLVGPISVLALKRGLGFGDTPALLCSAVQFCAGFALAPVSGRICRAFGPKFMLKNFSYLYLLVAVAWVVFPPLAALRRWMVFAAGGFISLLVGMGYILTLNAVSSYFLMACPDKKQQVPGSISLQLIVSVGAGLLGALASTGLVRLAEHFAPCFGGIFAADEMGVFRLYFLAIVPVFFVCHFFIGRLRVLLYDYRARYGHDGVVRLIRLAQCWRRMMRHH